MRPTGRCWGSFEKSVDVGELPTLPDLTMGDSGSKQVRPVSEPVEGETAAENETLFKLREGGEVGGGMRRAWAALEDIVHGFFGDMLYNMHRDFVLGLMIFAFVVSFLLLWTIAVDIFDVSGENVYTASFQKEPPSSALIGHPFPIFSISLLDKNLAKISGARVTSIAFPAESFPINITTQGGLIHTRNVDCVQHYYEDPGVWHLEDEKFCSAVIQNGEGVTDDDGVVTFENFTISSGPGAMHTVVFHVAVPDSVFDVGDVIEKTFLEAHIVLSSPVATLSPTTYFPSKVHTKTPYTITITGTIEKAPIENLTLTPFVYSAAISGRHHPIPQLHPMTSTSEYKLTEFTTDITSMRPTTSATFEMTLTVTPVWTAGGTLQYPALFLAGKSVLLGETIPGGVPVLYRPVEVVSGVDEVKWAASPYSEIVEGVWGDTLEVDVAGVGVEGVRGIMTVTMCNGEVLPVFWHGVAGGSGGYKKVVSPVSTPVEGGKARFTVLFSEDGVVGAYRVAVWFGGVKIEWNISVKSAVSDVVLWFPDSPWEGGGKVFNVGTDWDNAPSFYIRDAVGDPLRGKKVTARPQSEGEIGLSYESYPSDSSGVATFAFFQATFAVFEGFHTVIFSIDGVAVHRVEISLTYDISLSPVRCTHVDFQSATPTSITTVARNQFGHPLPTSTVTLHIPEQTPASFPTPNPSTTPYPGHNPTSQPYPTASPIDLTFSPSIPTPITLSASCTGDVRQFPYEGGTFHAADHGVPPTEDIVEGPLGTFTAGSDTVIVVQRPRRLAVLGMVGMMASDSGLVVPRRDAPGRYILATWRGGVWGGLRVVSVESLVGRVEVERESGGSVGQGIPFVIQPRVKVIGRNGENIAGVRVLAILNPPRIAENEVYTPPRMEHGCLALMDPTKSEPKLPISNPSGADGIASFSWLGILGGPKSTPLTITYVYLNHEEGGVYTSENISRTLTTQPVAVVVGQPSPMAPIGGTVKLPVSVISVDAANIPYTFLFGALVAVPYNESDALRGVTTAEEVIFPGTGSVTFTDVMFLPSSDLGHYKFKVILPGTSVTTTGVTLSRDPHVLQITTPPPSRIMVGTAFRVKVVARLADGSLVSGVVITSALVIRDFTTTCYGDGCGVVSGSSLVATTDHTGTAIFDIVITRAMTSAYRLEFTSRRGVDSILGAATSLSGAFQLYGGARVPEGGLAGFSPDFQQHLSARVEASARSLAVKMVTRALASAQAITVKTPDINIFNEVTLVNITVQPVLDSSSSGLSVELPSNYGVFSVMPVLEVKGPDGVPLGGRSVTVTVLPTVPEIIVDWDKTTRTDENGTYQFNNLRLNTTTPGTYQLLFHCEGQQSDVSIDIYLLPYQTILDFGSVYVRLFVIVVILLPWLLANLPGASRAWVFLAFILSSVMPSIILLIIPGVFDSGQLFVQMTLYLTITLWGGVTVLLIRLAVIGATQDFFEHDWKAVNSYRYVRWLSKLVPYSSDDAIHVYREQLAVSSLSLPRRVVLYLYNSYLSLRYDCGVLLTGTKTQYTWDVVGGISLHHSPEEYASPLDAFKWSFGVVLPDEGQGMTKVCVRIRGASIATVEANIVKQSVVEHIRRDIAEVYFTDDKTVANAVNAYFTMEGDGGDVRKIIEEKLIGKSVEENIVFDMLKSVEDGAARRDNIQGWSIGDSFTVWLHFAITPVVVEMQSYRTAAFNGGIQHIEDDDEEDDQLENDENRQEANVGRVWVRHSIPKQIKMSSGRSFPDFWSPNYDQETNLVLKENAPQDLNRVSLDATRPEDGGLPSDIVEPLHLPFRFLVCSSVCVVVIVVMGFLTWWVYSLFITYLTRIQNRIPVPPDMTAEEEAQVNEDLRRGVTTTIEAIVATGEQFYFLTAFIPTVEDMDFIGLWRWWYDLTKNLIKSSKTAGLVATVAGSTAVAANWGLLIVNTPKIMKSIRRNKPVDPTVPSKALCVTADRYVGIQAMHLVFAFAIIYAIVWVVTVLLLMPGFVDHIVTQYGTVILTAVVTSLGAVIAELYVKLNWTNGARVTKPVKYSRWQLFALALHTVSGAVTTVVRWVKSIVAQTLLFARLDLDLFPKSLNFLDTGYWAYHSMVYVNEAHTNPILQTFISILLTDRLLTKSTTHHHNPLTKYLKFTSSSRGAVAKITLYVDSPPVHPSGDPLVMLTNSKSMIFKYHHDSQRKKYTGCYICGSDHVEEYYTANPLHDAGYSHHKILVLKPESMHGTKLDFNPEYLKKQPTRGNVINDSTHVTSRNHVVKYEVKVKPDVEKWALVGSFDGDVWVTIHEGGVEPKKNEETVKMEVDEGGRRCFAVCVVCYATKRVAEGRPRRFEALKSVKLVSKTWEMSPESPIILEIVGKPQRIRGYAVTTTSNSDADTTDLTSWMVHATENITAPWLPIHEVVDVKLPPSRSTQTPIFPMWPGRGTPTDLSRVEKISRSEVMLPTMKQLMATRCRHLLGHEKGGLSNGDLKKGAKREQGNVFTSVAERIAWRGVRCHKGRWAMAFALVMNPSLIKLRKNARGGGGGVEANITAESASAELREGISSEWRRGEVVRRKSRAVTGTKVRAKSCSRQVEGGGWDDVIKKSGVVGGGEGCQIEVISPETPDFTGIYTAVEVPVGICVHDGEQVDVPHGVVHRILKAYIGTLDVTEAVSKGSKETFKKTENDKNPKGFDISTGETTSPPLYVTYTKLIYHLPGPTPTVMSQTHDGRWEARTPIPAPGFSHPYVVSSRGASCPFDEGLQWDHWDPIKAVWAEKIGFTVVRR